MSLEKLKIKQMLKKLESCRGNGTSLVSIMIGAGGDLNGTKKRLTDEYGKASNVKSRVNRQSILSALTSAQQKLKLYRVLPKNGLVLFCGDTFVGTKTKMINIAFEPFKPLHHKMYFCDNRFHVEPLYDLLQSEESYGFVVIDGNGAVFGQLSGDHKMVLEQYSVSLPKQHKAGGQSAARFDRLAAEARTNYIHKVSEKVGKHFIDHQTNGLNVKGIVVAGSAQMKDKLVESKYFDYRIKPAILCVLTISYGGLAGFDEAIAAAASQLSNIELVEEQQLLKRFFSEIARNTGMVCYGPGDTFVAQQMGALETLVISEKCQVQLVKLDDDTDEVEWKLFPAADFNSEFGDDVETLFEYVLDNHESLTHDVEVVSDLTPEGTEFLAGFGGIGGFLRWKIDIDTLTETLDDEYLDSDEFM